ncbi:Replication factor C (RF-C) subunit [Pleodorina starrii]|uniref:Replication factor C (RF-C) subunit n=1 Tax=Pleodorina starrii TaxID=330485 RepID=A0A9W6BWA3_9CHLO|nr:Replication factor C (RF-C) subunit [Pleodorina starrii]GLC59378.1 Replication factor C (RF-C) subunit [Pleodorina starrii]GLC74423.1 Replication factor C (RF-C) subunit [Pleodorina starrii]
MAIARQDISAMADLDHALAAPSSRLRTDGTVDGRNAPWVEKFRPKNLDEVAAHKQIIDTIKRLTGENRLPHLLLYGPPGTGKTSTILAVARQMYGNSLANMTLELNASDERGISVVRQEIQDFASTRTIFSNKFKLIILDECDAMTNDAQFALRRVIEKYTRNARFCLICNYVSKVIPALQSRCTKFRFAPLDPQFVRTRLQYVADTERVNLGPGGLDAVVELGNGDMRRSLNILQSCHMAFDCVDQQAVYLCTGNPLPADIAQVLHWLLNEPVAEVFRKVVGLQVDKGVALVDIVRELHPWIMKTSMPVHAKVGLVERLADVEHRLAYSTSERLQLGALVAAFVKAREIIAKAAK